MGLEELPGRVFLIHGDARVSGKLEAAWPGRPNRKDLSLGVSLVGAWYLTCLNSSSISWGARLNGELKTPGH